MLIKIFTRIRQFSKHPLTKKRPYLAFFRYLKFHIYHTVCPNPRIYKFIGETKFVAGKGMAGIAGNIYTGLFDFEEMAFLLHFLNSESTFLDIGANVGAYSLLASGVKGAQSYAIEPVPETYKYLVNNIQLNRLTSKVKCMQIGFSDQSGSLAFSTNKGTMNRVLKNNQNGLMIPVITIDQFIKEEKTFPELIKIDVEGFELAVIKGGYCLFSNPGCKVVFVELNGSGKKYGFGDQDVHNLLLSFCFVPIHYDPFRRIIKILQDYNKEKFNTIYVKNSDYITERVQASSKIKILNQYI